MLGSFPEIDHNQTLRIKRFLMAAVAYLMWSGLAVFVYIQGLTRISLTHLIIALTGVLICNLIVYGFLRSGLNKRFKDPSLTLAQMMMGTFWTMVVVYYADRARSLVLLLYLVVFVFGLFRLKGRQFLFLSMFSVANYSAVIFLLYKIHPESINEKTDFLSIVVLATVLPWFSLVGRYITSLKNQASKALTDIEHLTVIDDLTGVFNRRQMYKILELQKALSDRCIHPFSICIFNLDHFKTVNDTYGNDAGDIILKTLAQEVNRNLRDIDHIARYGDDEFMLILINSGSREAMVCAKRIRTMARELTFPGMPDDFTITISVGVTKYQSFEPIQDAINRAAKALYRAKENGRDLVEYEAKEAV